MTKELQTLTDEMKKFDALQTKLSKYGAHDTEPDVEFALVVERVYHGKDPKIPTTGSAWQLFTVSMPCERAAKQLTAQAKRVVDAINAITTKDRQAAAKIIEYNSRADLSMCGD